MNVSIYIVKRYLKTKRRNGQRRHRLLLRWKDPVSGKWQCENTGTADMTEAREVQKRKWAALNGVSQHTESPDEAAARQPSWDQCRVALGRAMTADNMRPSYIADALLLFDSLQRMFPSCAHPSAFTTKLANEYKRRRAEGNPSRGVDPVSPWTLRGDLATLKAVFGKWPCKECELLKANPFQSIRPPKCEDPEIRIVTTNELTDLTRWLNTRWNNWRLPGLFLEISGLLGWRAMENASLRREDLLPNSYVRVSAKASKTRSYKYGWLPEELHTELLSRSADGWVFGRFADELRGLLSDFKGQPHHAAKVKSFSPKRLVAWMQDELQRYNEGRGSAAAGSDSNIWQAFTLHDLRRTAITGMQMAGVSEKEASVMVGATPEVIRRHYEKMDRCVIARRNVERRLNWAGKNTTP